MSYRNNGEYWYRDVQPLVKRIRRWFVSCGWESPHWTQDGYTYRWQSRAPLSLRARGHRSRAFAIYSSLCPISLFGGNITFQPFGVSRWSRKRQAYYCLHYDFDDNGTRMRWYAYRSHNATPWGADTWYFGAPANVLRAAEKQHQRMATAREERESREAAAS